MPNIDKYDNFLSTLCGTSSNTWTEAQESALLEPYTYIAANPGKDIVGKFIEGCNLWLNVPGDERSVIERIIRLFYSACLLLDDVQDDSHLRRGMPAAHMIFGVPQTINTANYLCFLAYQELSTLRPAIRRCNPASSASSDGEDSVAMDKSDFPVRTIHDDDLNLAVNAELMALYRGQGMEILWRDTLRCPSEDEYLGMVRDKTGGVLRVTAKLMIACSTTNTDVDYVPLANLIGVYYQIRDDYMNLQSDQYANNKGFADDLSEGKFSFPIIHGILENPENRQIMSVLQKRPRTPTLKHQVINYLRDTTKSFEYTLAVLNKLEQQCRAEVERLGGNPVISAILDKIHVDA